MPHHHRPFDWSEDQVFDGYDPVVDSFAYPVELPAPAPATLCTCTVVPPSPGLLPDSRFDAAIVSMCDYCMTRLLLL